MDRWIFDDDFGLGCESIRIGLRFSFCLSSERTLALNEESASQ